jgi:hypothetical protein
VGALDRLGHVWDRAVAPPSDLVTEEPEPARDSCPDRTLRHDAAVDAVARSDRGLLDDESSLRYADLER